MGYASMKFEHSTTVPLIDEFVYAGKAWRIGATFTGLVASGTGYVIFKTPANAITLYQISEVGKTGGECFVTLKEGFTLTGTPTAITTPYNVNRNYKDSVCKLTQLGYGTSAVVGAWYINSRILSIFSNGKSCKIYFKLSIRYAVQNQLTLPAKFATVRLTFPVVTATFPTSSIFIHCPCCPAA